MPEIFIGSDHRGYELKNSLVAKLSGGTALDQRIAVKSPETGENYTVSDLGPFSYDETDDYNDAAEKVARAVRENQNSRGILICGSAHGICIQANRFKGIRAIEGYSEELVEIGREHNDANILCLSADFIEDNKIDIFTIIFLSTKFSGEERHVRRNQKLDEVGEN